MAYIGLYGVYYNFCSLSEGVWNGNYSSQPCKKMGKAIAASFTPQDAGENNLYADNAIAETANTAAAGGTLSLTLDRLNETAIADLFGLTATTETVTVNSTTVSGRGFNYTGNESAAAVGIAFIRQKQEDNNRNHYEVLIFGCVTFKYPSEDAQTLGDTVEWQTPTIEGTVTTGTETSKWMKRFEFPTQAAAIAYIQENLSE